MIFSRFTLHKWVLVTSPKMYTVNELVRKKWSCMIINLLCTLRHAFIMFTQTKKNKTREKSNDNNSKQNKTKQTYANDVRAHVSFFFFFFFATFIIEIKMIACPQINVCVRACMYLFFYTNFYILISFHCVLFARSFHFIHIFFWFITVIFSNK